MKILFLGDVVGGPGRGVLKTLLPRLRKEGVCDCVIVNGENMAGGSGVTPDTVREVFAAGADVITTGDHVFKKQESKIVLETMDVLRPLNYGPFAYGRGWLVKDCGGAKIGVLNLIGRVFMQPLDCPFRAAREIIEDIKRQAKIVIVDMHAEATSEKLALGHYLAGKATAVCGTHTHVPTADQRILEGYTAYTTDVGMVGSYDSVLGREKQKIIEKFVTNMPVKFDVASGDVRAQGVLIDADIETGRAHSIERVEYTS